MKKLNSLTLVEQDALKAIATGMVVETGASEIVNLYEGKLLKLELSEEAHKLLDLIGLSEEASGLLDRIKKVKQSI
jgi:hypothetical protein